MGLTDLFKTKREYHPIEKISPTNDLAVSLTTTGREKAEQMSLPSPQFEVSAAILEAGGTATYSEIARDPGIHFPRSKVEMICNSLVKSGYLKPLKLKD